MSATSWVRTPVGPGADRWTTLPVDRTVLVVVHTVASANRLADILPVLGSDARVQIVFTAIGASAVSEGVVEALAGLGGIVIPWEQATATRFDLAIAVNHSGELWRIRAPLAVLSHGIGYTKYANGRRHRPDPCLVEPRAESREPRAESRKPLAGYGMSPDWLLHDGHPFVDALVLSHDEQLTRLASVVPEALPTAVVAGDPCFDRMRASLPLRERYRRRIGATPDTTVVTISSTWGRESVLGAWPTLVHELLSELPVDSYRVLLVAHPNVWFAHGPWQLRNWLSDATRAGLTIVDPEAGWQQAVLAGDILIGDHGAVTGYGAALGIPTLLATARPPDVVDGTAIDVLTRSAPRLTPGRPLRPQLDAAEARPAWSREVADLISAFPDDSAARLRTLFYRLLDLPEPVDDPAEHPYAAADLPAGRPPVTATLIEGSATTFDRYPADVRRHRSPLTPEPNAGLAVHAEHPIRALRAEAGFLYCSGEEILSDEDAWLSSTFDRWPACRLTAVLNKTSCTVYAGPGRYAELTPESPDTALLFATALYLWLSEGKAWEDLPPILTVRGGIDAPTLRAGVVRLNRFP